MKIKLAIALLALAVTGACGTCPKCPLDSVDGVGVALIKNPNSAERGAIASVLQVLTAQAGPESIEVRAIDSALASRRLVVGQFFPSETNPEIRGYVLMKDGTIAIDISFIRSAPADSNYLADQRTWPMFPMLYAAGHRLAHGGTWRDSIAAAGTFADDLAEGVESGRVDGSLPADTNRALLARYLRDWKLIY